MSRQGATTTDDVVVTAAVVRVAVTDAERETRVHERLEDPTDEWGVRVEGVEIREIERSTDDAE